MARLISDNGAQQAKTEKCLMQGDDVKQCAISYGSLGMYGIPI